MKLHSLLLLIHFWINVNAKGYILDDDRFTNYRHCLKKFSVPLWQFVGPQSNRSYYELFNFQFNKVYEKVYPIGIFTPKNAYDVQAAVTCGVKHKIGIVPISGGHSYAGLSIGTDDSILIDFRYMNHITIDRRRKVATVQAGTFLGHLYGQLWKNGKFGAPLGVCATVAMGGLVLGGGIGYFSTLYGLTIDNVLEMNMVDARGHAVHINKTHNQDLWWAMRGVGPGYIGLLTSVKIKLFKAENITVTYVRKRFYNDKFATVMENYIKWLDWVKKNDPSINTVIYIYDDKSYPVNEEDGWGGIEVQVIQLKDPNKNNTGNLRFLDHLDITFSDSVQTIKQSLRLIDFIIQNGYNPVVGSRPNKTDTEKYIDYYSKLTRDMATPRYFFAKSFYVKKTFSALNLVPAEKILLRMPNNKVTVEINSEQGIISNITAKASSYVHRNVLFNLRVFFESENVEDYAPSKIWAKNFLKAVSFLDSGETYQNYPDRELNDYLQRFYGDNLNRLIDIKRKWDPKGYFNSKMSLPIN